MERQKNITLFFEFFDHEHLGKDPFMVPYYLGKALGYAVNIVYPLTESNRDLPSEIKGIRLKPLAVNSSESSNTGRNFVHAMYQDIWKHAKEIDVLMRFFDVDISRKAAFLYKLRNPHGKVYVKMDVNPYNINDNVASFPFNMIRGLKGKLLKSCVDVISCETKLALQKLNASPNSYNHWGKKMVYLPNGFDEALLESLHIKEKSYAEKENIMLTVGRLGTPPKNTQMLLKALAMADLKDWKFYLVGPIEPSLQSDIDSFYQQNPDKKDSVIFTGAIYDKKELWEYYNRSKVFVLTSKWESFALVYTEAQRFTNYIMSTKVGAASDVIQDGKYGDFIPQEDYEALAHKLNDIINGKVNINVYDGFDVKSLSWEARLKVIADKLKS